MYWIIGDIHGMLAPLETLLAEIARRDKQAQLLFAGDYVNRGPDSKHVIDLLLTLENARFLRGNHDDIFEQVLTGRTYAANATNGDRAKAFTWFMEHGLANTLRSYGAGLAMLDYLVEYPNRARLNELLRQIVPDTHRRFIHNLAPVIEEENFFVAHGKWDPAGSTDEPSISTQLLKDPAKRSLVLWGRFTLDEILVNKAWDRVGYFGHTPVDNYSVLQPTDGRMLPILAPKIVLIDTAAALSRFGRLTAFCHETQSYIQAHRSGQLIEGE